MTSGGPLCPIFGLNLIIKSIIMETRERYILAGSPSTMNQVLEKRGYQAKSAEKPKFVPLINVPQKLKYFTW